MTVKHPATAASGTYQPAELLVRNLAVSIVSSHLAVLCAADDGVVAAKNPGAGADAANPLATIAIEAV